MTRLPCVEHRCTRYAVPGKSRCADHQRAWDQGRWDRGGTGQRGSQNQPRAKRRQVLSEQRWRCAVCKTDKGPLFLHHVDGNARNNVRKNLVGLCADCHDQAHAALLKRTHGR